MTAATMTTLRKSTIELDESQQFVINCLYERLRGTSENLHELDEEKDIFNRSFEYSNVFGVFGPRGAGKSTVLYELYESMGQRKDGLLVLPMFDCSMIPPDVMPSVAVLSRISLYLQKLLEEEGRITKEDDEHMKMLSKLKETCSRTDAAYRDLYIELSSSPSDYSTHLLRGIDERLRLGGDLWRWLQRITKALDINAMVVILDDFDLVPDDQVRRWLFSFLDELHQTRLLLVMAADYNRLEHLAWDPRTGFDDKTGRAVLHKIVPTQNRFDLQIWSESSRSGFPRKAEPDLAECIDRYSAGWSAGSALLLNLLPHRPRGLVNLYESLVRSLKEESGRKEEVGPAEIRRTLSVLATCRNEPLLARDLASRRLGEWLRLFSFGEDSLTVEEWIETVEASYDRARKRNGESGTKASFLEPLWSLVPPGDVEAADTINGSRKGGVTETQPGSRILSRHKEYHGGFLHDPTWRDPFRHDVLWLAPMRDAEPEAWPCWIELLLNLAMREFDKQETGAVARRRVSFLERWGPAAHRLGRARFKVEVTRSQLRDFFLEHEDESIRPALSWLTWQVGGGSRVEIGWKPLLDALRGNRDPLLAEQLSDLALRPSIVCGEVPVGGSPDALKVLPSEVWALVVLVDALDRCNWKVFSGPLGIPISTYLALAGVMVRSAYLHALTRAELVSRSELSPDQEKMVDRLDARDPTGLLRLPVEELDSYLHSLLAESQPNITGKDTLSEAARSFMGSAAYGSLLHLRRPIPACREREPV